MSDWKNSGNLEQFVPHRRLFRCCCNMCCKKDDDPEAGYPEPALLVSGPMVTVIKVRALSYLGSLQAQCLLCEGADEQVSASATMHAWHVMLALRTSA